MGTSKEKQSIKPPGNRPGRLLNASYVQRETL